MQQQQSAAWQKSEPSRHGELTDQQISEFERMRAADRVIREENMRLTEELKEAKERLADEQGGGIASARAMAEGRKSFNKGLKEFANNTLAALESELADWKTRAVVAETEVERLDNYMNSYLPQSQSEIMRLRQLLADHGVDGGRGGSAGRR